MPGICPESRRQDPGEWCCWVLPATKARLGCRAVGEQEGCLARKKEKNYHLLGNYCVWILLSTIDTLVQGKRV